MIFKDDKSLLYIRAFPGYTGGKLIARELVVHVPTSYNWKEFLVNNGSSFDCTSILKSGLVAVGRTIKNGRQTVFFAPPNPIFETEPGEILTSDDFTKPRMEHYRSKWRPSRDAVHWVNLARAQDEGVQCWQTRSNAIVVYSSVPPECIYKVISPGGERVLFERLATPRPPPKVVLKSSWQTQQQQPARRFRECISSQLETICGYFGEGKMKNNPGNSTEESETSRNRKLLRSDVPYITHVEEKPEFKVDHRIEVIAHNVILKDEERMGQIQEVVEKLRTDS